MDTESRRLQVLRGLIAFAVVSTAAHFTHNFVEIDRYPDSLVSGDVVQVAILVSWPLFTAIGLYGLRLYARGAYERAHVCLVTYAVMPLTTPGHFLDGSPDIPPFWFATIFTDALAGLALVGFVVCSARALRRTAAPA